MTFTETLYNLNIEYKRNVCTAELSSIKVGGNAKYTVYPKTADELVLSIKTANAFSEKNKLIGGCTNTFFADEGYDGVIIRTKKLNKLDINGGSISAEAGVSLSALMRLGASADLDLGDGLFGIPGTLGGALHNNAGAYGKEISDVFEYGFFYDAERDKVIKLGKNELSFSYRSSILQKENLIFLSGKLQGKARASEEIKRNFQNVIKKRRMLHPTEPSLGSFFKRTDGVIPAFLIEKAELKGKRIGAAAVSTKHAGFIINTGGAASYEVDTLAKEIETTILKRFGVTLVREAEFVK